MILQRELTDSAWKKTIIRPSKTKIGGIDLLTRRILQKTLSQRIFAVNTYNLAERRMDQVLTKSNSTIL
jgi:hypothetical protein